MPKYPGRKSSLKKSSMIAESEGKKVVFKKRRTMWPIMTKDLSALKKETQKKYLSAIKDLSKTFPRQKHRVLDWGCGHGGVIMDLASRFPEVEFIGFSRDAYRADWSIAPKNVKFLHTTKEVLERYLQREKKKGNSLHLIVSHFGLEHLSLRELTTHLSNISPHLPIGARIITNPLFFDGSKSARQEILLESAEEKLEEAGYKLEFVNRSKDGPRYLISLKKVK